MLCAPQDHFSYRSPSWLSQKTESKLDAFNSLLAEMESETRALHKEWSDDGVSTAPAVDFDGGASGSMEQRVRSLDLEERRRSSPVAGARLPCPLCSALGF